MKKDLYGVKNEVMEQKNKVMVQKNEFIVQKNNFIKQKYLFISELESRRGFYQLAGRSKEQSSHCSFPLVTSSFRFSYSLFDIFPCSFR